MTDRIVRVVLRGDIVGLKAAMAEGAAVVKGTAAEMTAATKTAERSGVASATSSAKVTAARKLEADASGAVRVAETRLAEVRTKGTAKASQVAAAEERLAKAQRAQAAAAEAQAVKFRGGLATIGTQAGKVGLVAAVGLGLAVKSAADFNAEMALVRTLSHAGASDMDRLSHAALTVGQNIGYSAKAVAQGEEELIKAGVSVKDILGGGLKGALDLAAAGQTDVATATSIAASALTQFNLKGKDVPHVADELAAGADKALGSVEDLGLGLTQAGTTAHQMGFSLEQTVGTLTAFAQAGLIGERGGTTFKQMLLQLAAPTSIAQKLMDKYGISLYNAAGQIKTMPELADNLSKSLKDLDPKARNAALGIIFGSRAIQGANILMANGAKGIQEWIDKTNDQGFAAQQAAGKLDSLAGDAKKLGTALQTAFIGTGNGSQGPLRSLTQDATAAVTAFNKMPDSLHSTVSGMLAITAVAGGGLWFGSKMIRGIADTRLALDNLGLDATRVGATIRAGLAVGAVLEGLQLLDQGMDAIFNKNLNESNLQRSLTSLAQGRVTGEIKDKFGKDLSDFGDQAYLATNKVNALNRTLSKVPLVGGFLSGDFLPHDTESATQNIQKLDDALASMVEGGQAQQAAAIFEQLRKSAMDAGVSAKDFAGLFDQYSVAVGNAGDASLATSGAARLMSGAMTGLLRPTKEAAAAAAQGAADQDAMAKALEESRKAANKTAHEFFGLGKSVNDSKVSLNGWISDLEKQAKSLRDFTKNAQTAGKKGLKEGLIAELEAAGPEGALRMKQLADASEKEIRRANRAWGSGQRAIDKYTNVVGGVPPIVATDLVVNGVPVAISAVSALKRLMDSLHDRAINIKVTKTTNATLAEAAANSGKTGADGMTVPHAAAGWTVPGRRFPYRDSVHAFLAPSEEVVSDRYGGASKNRSALKAASKGATLAVVGMAAGGTAGLASPMSEMARSTYSSWPGYGQPAATAGDRLLGYRDARNAHVDALRTVLAEMPVQRVPPGLLDGMVA